MRKPISFVSVVSGPVLGVVLGSFGCSPGPMPVSRSANDPSNPNAPEGAMTVAHVHAHGAPNDGVSPVLDGRGSGDVTYVCPMHPDVTSHEPGVCPKCNMKLVPKK